MSAPQSQQGNTGDDDDNEGLLVSEFPPPPTYFRQAAFKAASTTTPSANNGNSNNKLVPPPIPTTCFEKAAKRVAKNVADAQAAAEAEISGKNSAVEAAAQANSNLSLVEEVTAVDNEEDDVVGVFGEVVEDPVLLTPLLDDCSDPLVVRDTVIRLNKESLLLFVTLIDDIVNRPLENKKTREEISQKVFLMLQECNKFREHQGREILIEILEKQLVDRRDAITKLKQEIETVDDYLKDI